MQMNPTNLKPIAQTTTSGQHPRTPRNLRPTDEAQLLDMGITWAPVLAPYNVACL